MYIKNIFFTSFLLLVYLWPSKSPGQDTYQIDFKIEGLKDTTVFLGYYFGDGTYLKDTAFVNDQGEFIFSDNEILAPGVYFLVLDRSKLFDFIINDNQSFHIQSDFQDLIKFLDTNEQENMVFFDHVRYMVSKSYQVQPLRKLLADSTISKSEKSEAQLAIDELNEAVLRHQDSIVSRFPGFLVSKYIKAQIQIPNPYKDDPENKDKAYAYYRSHFWDNFDLTDEAMIRFAQPIYRQKIEEYLNNLFPQNPDTLIPVIEKLIAKASKNQETFKYLVWNLTLNYQYPKLMGLDAIFVHLYDHYFANGKMDFWANNNLKENLKKRAGVLKNTLIGKTAPNLIIQDLNKQPRALNDLKSNYTIIYFYDPDCGFCKKETPKLRDFINKTAKDISVYAVCADSSLVKMNDYIDEMKISNWVNVNGPRTYTVHYQKIYDAETTPTIYILNDEKEIIAKKITAEQIDGFLENYEHSKNNN